MLDVDLGNLGKLFGQGGDTTTEQNDDEGKDARPLWKRYRRYPYLRQDDSVYRDFMISLLINLEPRHFARGEQIYNELDSADEIHFVMQGTYDIGYNLNRHKRYRLQFGDRTIIAGFNVANNRRMQFNFRAHNEMITFSIRHQNWYRLQREFEYFTEQINQKFVMFYNNMIRKPLTLRKQKEIMMLNKRSGCKQIIVMKDVNSDDIFNIRHAIYNRIELSNNLMLEEFKRSMELIKKVDQYETLIERVMDHQQEILYAIWIARGFQGYEYDFPYLEKLVDEDKEYHV